MQPLPRMVPRLMSGQGMLLYGQMFLARVHISCVVFSLHFVRMWSIDSVVLQVSHVSLCSCEAIFLQYSPIMCVPCIVLYRNCWMRGFIMGFRRLRQIVASVSFVRHDWFMDSRVSCMLFLVVFLGSTFFLSRIPLYAFACVRVANFASCVLNSSGISRF